ncbi:hypothetical protein N9N67_05220 [Bacteriovoracaceae bacterium]|nr:hypothetical protein [Bacteriovoracaceae bacterium]
MRDSAFYYLLQDGVILRLEDQVLHKNLPSIIKDRLFNDDDEMIMQQSQANYRVLFFRDRIFNLEEFIDYFYGFGQ